MWTSGQWAYECGGISQPVVEPPAGPSQIIDDQDYNFFAKGCSGGTCPYWNVATTGYNNQMWWTYVNGSTPDYWAHWAPNLPLPGRYEVYAHIPCSNATTWQATYSLATTNGYWSAFVDQFGLCNQWVSLGLYSFRQGYYPDTYNVYLFDATGIETLHCQGYSPPTCKIEVDALLFVRRGHTIYFPPVTHE